MENQDLELKGTLILIDDSSSARKLLKAILETSGFKVFDFNNPVQALESLPESNPDAILTDYEMPQMRGPDVVRSIKKDPKFSHIPVVLLSMHEGDGHVLECIEAGADDYIPKKMNPEVFISRIKLIIQAKKYRQLKIQEERLRTYKATIISISHELNNSMTLSLPLIGQIEKLIPQGETASKLEKLKVSLLKLTQKIQQLQNLETVEFTDYVSQIEQVKITK